MSLIGVFFHFHLARGFSSASSHQKISQRTAPPVELVAASEHVPGWRLSFLQESAQNDMNLSDDDEEDEVDPGEMRVSEIKAELDLRDVSYADCFDKDSLEARLQEARATGKANPDILDKFNKDRLEQQFSGEKVDLDDEELLKQATANDGKLPGGLDPEMFQKLISNPEIMVLLQSTKMQEAMQLMMTGGREELEEKLKSDPELQETVKKLDGIMKGI